MSLDRHLDNWHPTEISLIANGQDLLEQATVHLGSYIEKCQRHGKLTVNRFSYLYFLTRVFNLTKYVKRASEQIYSRDVIAFIRSIYENYLRLRCLRFSPTFAVKFVRGERVNFSDLVRATGSDSDQALHKELYPFLSGITHTDMRDVNLYFSLKDGFFTEQGDSVLTLVYLTSCMLSLLFAELSLHRYAPEIAQQDAAVMGLRLSRWAYKAHANLPSCGLLKPFPVLKRRIRLIRRGEFRRL